jgi:hypothetical protein
MSKLCRPASNDVRPDGRYRSQGYDQPKVDPGRRKRTLARRTRRDDVLEAGQPLHRKMQVRGSSEIRQEIAPVQFSI